MSKDRKSTVTSGRGILALGIAAAGTAWSGMVFSQVSPAPTLVGDPGGTIDLQTPVIQRSRPDFDPLGIHIGAFYAYPTLQLSEQYDDNVYALRSNPIGDVRTQLSPSIDLRSDWNRHALALISGADIFRYARRVSENISDTQTTATGRLDISGDDTLNGRAGYRLLHEERGSPDAVNGKTPTRYQLITSSLGYVREGPDLQLRLDGDINRYFYDNVASSTGTIINQTYRNRAEYDLSPQVGYRYLPQSVVFLKAGGSVRSYDARADPAGFDRNSTGYLVAVGTGTSIHDTLTGSVYVGYTRQHYRDARLTDSGGLAFSGDLLWTPTALSSVSLHAARTVEETTVAGTSGALQIDIKAELQHQFRANLLGRLSGEFTQRDYQGIRAADKLSSATVEVRYLINPYVSANATYSFQNRSTPSIVGTSFNRNIVGVALTGKF